MSKIVKVVAEVPDYVWTFIGFGILAWISVWLLLIFWDKKDQELMDGINKIFDEAVKRRAMNVWLLFLAFIGWNSGSDSGSSDHA